MRKQFLSALFSWLHGFPVSGVQTVGVDRSDDSKFFRVRGLQVEAFKVIGESLRFSMTKGVGCGNGIYALHLSTICLIFPYYHFYQYFLLLNNIRRGLCCMQSCKDMHRYTRFSAWFMYVLIFHFQYLCVVLCTAVAFATACLIWGGQTDSVRNRDRGTGFLLRSLRQTGLTVFLIIALPSHDLN